MGVDTTAATVPSESTKPSHLHGVESRIAANLSAFLDTIFIFTYSYWRKKPVFTMQLLLLYASRASVPAVGVRAGKNKDTKATIWQPLERAPDRRGATAVYICQTEDDNKTQPKFRWRFRREGPSGRMRTSHSVSFRPVIHHVCSASSILVYGGVDAAAHCLLTLPSPDGCPVLCLKHSPRFLLAGLRNGTVVVYERSAGGKTPPPRPRLLSASRSVIQ